MIPAWRIAFFRGASLVLWDVVRREEGGLLSTRQWICEGHSVSSGILFFRNQRDPCQSHPRGQAEPLDRPAP